MGHRAYGASSSCSVPKFPPNLSCAAFSLVSGVKKKKIRVLSVFSLLFSFALLFTRVSNPQQLLRQTAQPLSRRTQAVSLSEQTPALT